MKILVIGNGFDLAHGLPTKYSDFLDFVSAFLKRANDKESWGGEDTSFGVYFSRVEKEQSKRYEEYISLASENRLLDYFLNIYEERYMNGKNGWIDFEGEISYIIKALDIALKEYKEQVEEGKQVISFFPSYVDKITRQFLLVKEDGMEHQYKIPDSFIDGRVDDLLKDLNRITRLLELYLADYVGELRIENQLPEFIKRSMTHVLSFNYTNTFRKLYDPEGKMQYCYIHGQAKRDGDVDGCSLVLGIDEYLPDERRDSDNAFVRFKKFYQRIYKVTSSEYFDWIDDYEKYLGTTRMKNDLYIYGHSLDVTDKDVLQYLILSTNMTTYIFYYSREDLANKISNLVKIIGEDELIQRTKGKMRSIQFCKTGATADPWSKNDSEVKEIEDLLN